MEAEEEEEEQQQQLSPFSDAGIGNSKNKTSFSVLTLYHRDCKKKGGFSNLNLLFDSIYITLFQ